MKKHFIFLLFLALAVGGGIIAQSISSIDRAVKDVEGNVQSVNPPLAVLSKALVDNNGTISLKASSGGLVYEGTKNDYQSTFTFEDPTQDNSPKFPDAGGTVTYNSVSAQAATATLDQSVLYGATITNTGASGAVVLTLPDPVVGMEFTVFLTVAQDVDINAATGTQILVLTNATGDAISSAATIGNRITLRAVSATEWIPLETSGTWTDVN